VLISGWLVAAMLLTVAAQAAAPSESSSAGRPASAFDPANEVTVTGTVERFEAHSEGGLLGLHLLISASGNTVDAHLGRYFSKENQEALQAGEPVQIVGVNENAHGRTVLLARQVIFGGRVVTVRNERGFIVHPHKQQGTTRDSKPVVNGGAQ
jgi:hypothetical protein